MGKKVNKMKWGGLIVILGISFASGGHFIIDYDGWFGGIVMFMMGIGMSIIWIGSRED